LLNLCFEYGEWIDLPYAESFMGVVARADYDAYFNPITGKGSHATDTPDDMDVQHFCGARDEQEPHIRK